VWNIFTALLIPFHNKTGGREHWIPFLTDSLEIVNHTVSLIVDILLWYTHSLNIHTQRKKDSNPSVYIVCYASSTFFPYLVQLSVSFYMVSCVYKYIVWKNLVEKSNKFCFTSIPIMLFEWRKIIQFLWN